MSGMDRDASFAAIREAMMASYMGALGTTRLSPFEALEQMAAALGSIYREIAAAHLDPNGCPCGWQPHDLHDLIALEHALGSNAMPDEEEPLFDLRTINPVGHG